MQLVTVGDMAGFGRQRRRDERGAEVAATRKTGTRVSTSHAGWFAALHICAERHAYSSGAALLRAWPFSFLFCLIGNGPFGLWRRREAARAAQRPTAESSYIQLHRRAAPFHACGCRRQPSKPGVFDTRGDTSVYYDY